MHPAVESLASADDGRRRVVVLALRGGRPVPAVLAATLATSWGIRGPARAHPAPHGNRSQRFHRTDHDLAIAYSKRAGDSTILCVVSLDPFHPHRASLDLDLGARAHVFEIRRVARSEHQLEYHL